MRRFFSIRIAWVALFSVVAAAPARAGNDDEIFVGNDAALLGGAVTAIAVEGSALWYNPAGIVHTAFDSVDLSISAATVRWVSMTSFLQAPNGQQVSGDYTELLIIPSALTYSRRLNDEWALAVGVFVPRYNEIRLKSVLDVDGNPPTQWAASITDVLHRYHFAAGVGWQPLPDWRFGMMISGVYETETSSTQFSGAEQVASNASFATVFDQTLRQSLGIEVRLGVQWDIGSWRLGAALQTPGIFFANNINTLATGAVTIVDPNTGVATNFQMNNEDDLDFGTELLSPLRLRVGGAYLAGAWTFAADADIRTGLKDSAISFSQEPTWNVRLGSQVQLSDRWLLGLGMFTDRSGNDPEQQFRVNFWGGSGGVRYTNMRKLAPEEKHDRLYFSTTIALRYAYGSGDGDGLVIPRAIADAGNITDNSVEVDVHELTIHIGSALYF